MWFLVFISILLLVVIGMLVYANWPKVPSPSSNCGATDGNGCGKPQCGSCGQRQCNQCGMPKPQCHCPKKQGCPFC